MPLALNMCYSTFHGKRIDSLPLRSQCSLYLTLPTRLEHPFMPDLKRSSVYYDCCGQLDHTWRSPRVNKDRGRLFIWLGACRHFTPWGQSWTAFKVYKVNMTVSADIPNKNKTFHNLNRLGRVEKWEKMSQLWINTVVACRTWKDYWKCYYHWYVFHRHSQAI